ncbi:hypothetical protein V8F20_003453 [Naviculisporaceae sp. PSN 640]
MGFADKLKGKKIAVIGGSSGIGFGAAQILLEAGANVTIVSSSAERVNTAVERLKAAASSDGTTVTGVVGDVRDEEAFTQVLLSLAPLDHIVFSSVDRIIRGSLAESDLEEAKHLFGVKFWGSVVVGKALAKHQILTPGGSLTLTSGAAALRPKKGAVLGSALNSGVISLTSSLADELAEKKIRVNTVVPGLVKTELWDKMGHSPEKQEQLFENGKNSLPVGFVATPEHIAESYLYLVRADYATGSVIVIDGGGSL